MPKTKQSGNSRKKSTAGMSAELEVSVGRPSRKSTRKSKNHQKQDDNLRLRQTMRSRSPSARNARATVRRD